MSDFLEELEEEIRKAKEEIVIINGDLKEKERLERRRKSLIEKISHLSAMKRKYLEGVEKGKKEIEIARTAIEKNFDDITI